MKKIITLVVFICISITTYSQVIDTIFTTSIYTSYFNMTYKEPLYVVYKLYRGGGDANRAGMNFKGIKDITATDKDYSHTPYDKGHLANAEDFAYSTESLELTFRYYNCLPQTANLNRGVWKKQETRIRKESISDSLLIICGGYDFVLIDKLYVPSRCFKIVKNIRTNKITHVLVFTNNIDDNTAQETNMNILIKNSSYTKLLELIK